MMSFLYSLGCSFKTEPSDDESLSNTRDLVCGEDKDCEKLNKLACDNFICKENNCVNEMHEEGFESSFQIVGDCKSFVCSSEGKLISINSDDPPVTKNICRTQTCIDGIATSTKDFQGSRCETDDGNLGFCNIGECKTELTCNDVRLDCDNNTFNGCETMVDENNCGGCGVKCVLPKVCEVGMITDRPIFFCELL